MRYAIFDLDNCLSADAWRRHFIDPKLSVMHRYHAYHSLCSHDECGNMDYVQHAHESGCGILILTARPAHYRPQTLFWLREHFGRHGIVIKHLLMRPDNDHSSSAELKRRMMMSWTWEYGVALADVAIAYDDKPSVVAVYRSLGLRAERLLIDPEVKPDHPKFNGDEHA